jgi:hypothetical protein
MGTACCLLISALSTLAQVTYTSASSPSASVANDLTNTSGLACISLSIPLVGTFTAGVQNPGRLVDTDVSNYATIRLTGIGCVGTIGVDLSTDQVVEPGGKVGFVVSRRNREGDIVGLDLADANVLTAFSVNLYAAGSSSPSQTATGGGLLALDVLDLAAGTYRLTYTNTTGSPVSFRRIRLAYTGLVTVVDDLRVLSAFYQPRPAPLPPCNSVTFTTSTNPAASTAASPLTGTSTTGLSACVSLTVPVLGVQTTAIRDAGNLADTDLTNYATIRLTGVNCVGSVGLDLSADQTLEPGGKVGFVIGRRNSAGDIIGLDAADVNLLAALSIKLYPAASNTPTLTATAAALLVLDVLDLGGGKYRLTYTNTTGSAISFGRIALSYRGLVEVLDDLRVFTAFYEGTGPSCSTPVTLAAFTAQEQQGNVLLAWRTVREFNHRHFEVQHSTDARTFETLAVVEGTSPDGTAYQYRHEVPTQTRIHYYRLRQVDRDGTAAYSPMRSVTLAGYRGIELAVIGNPVERSELTLRIEYGDDSLSDRAEVLLQDAVGRTLARQCIQLRPGSNQVQFSTKGLPTGLYFAVLSSASLPGLKAARVFVLSR